MIVINKILCPIDFSKASCEALNIAGNLARPLKAELCVMHVLEPVGSASGDPADIEDIGFDGPQYDASRAAAAERELCDLLKRLQLSSVTTKVVVRSGPPAEEILDVAKQEEADLIVMAAHGSAGWRRYLFGAVTDEVLYPAHCSVLVVKETAPAGDGEEAVSGGQDVERAYSSIF